MFWRDRFQKGLLIHDQFDELPSPEERRLQLNRLIPSLHTKQDSRVNHNLLGYRL